MKIICDKALLLDAALDAARAVCTKSSLATLEGLLLKASDRTLTITGFDLEIAITSVIEVDELSDGEIVIPAKLFLDMIKRMPGGKISIETDEKMLCSIKSGQAAYDILGLPAADFPGLPKTEEGDILKLKQSTLKSMISQTLFAIASNESKPVHTGSKFTIEDKKLVIVSVDGFRLALRQELITTDGEFTFIVPGKALGEIEKILDDTDEEMEIKITRKHIVFKIGSCEIVSRLLSGDFLDYKSAIPKMETTTVLINTRQFLEAIERTSLLISDRIKSPLRLKFVDNLVKLSCSTGIGKAFDEIDCKMTGETVEIGFNSKFLIDALRAVEEDEVKLLICGALSPMRIVPLSGEDYLFLVLPVRLKGE